MLSLFGYFVLMIKEYSDWELHNQDDKVDKYRNTCYKKSIEYCLVEVVVKI